MKRLSVGLLVAVSLVLCAGGGGGGDSDELNVAVPAVAERATVSLPTICSPLSPPGQQGCATGQKCTWISVQETPTEIGKVGCVPEGTVPLGRSCTPGRVGESTGFDNCRGGSVCSGVCFDICGFDAAVEAACAVGYACARVPGLFASGDERATFGVCQRQ